MIRSFLKENRGGIGVYFVCTLLSFGIFWLYRLPMGAALYPTVLCTLILCGYMGYRYYLFRKKQAQLAHLSFLPDDLLSEIGRYDTMEDQEYGRIIERIENLRVQERVQYESSLSDSMDYYSAWVHQIKTPISSMKLKLEQEDSPLSRSLSEDLFRIEQYVGMVLTYQRLQSDTTDYVFREHSLEKIVKGAVRKFAGQFIGKGIRLELSLDDRTVVTDDKWFSFVLEQVLSNALKYTREGSISIYLEEPFHLCIRDTGIGIAPEDLPRIFEKGYTGENGRVEKSASGLGLYLCRQICGKLGIIISACSVPGEGTLIDLDLEQKHTFHE
ncbi:MAG: sensor histidine kinase [Acetatifactor sp.]